MNAWDWYPWVAGIAIACWVWGAWRTRQGCGSAWLIAGSLVMLAFVAGLTWSLGRPPLRTMAETRLAYAVLLPLTGVIMAWRWQAGWARAYTALMAALFAGITWMRPDTHDRALMPALQSGWFVPHVVVYLVAYACLTAASLAAMRGVWMARRDADSTRTSLAAADAMVLPGFAFLTLGLVFGALWAKEAWGHYWTWDPKETWAFLTWGGYLAYLHARRQYPQARKAALGGLSAAWVVLLACWFGVNYLPSAASSVHTYAQ
jgi:ABC-type transport system involved in cytochrome c biogenesis permease subunit